MTRTVHLYIYSLPFVSAFALTGTINWPVILATLVFILVLSRLFLRQFPGMMPVDNTVILSVLFLVAIWASYFYNGMGNIKSANHLMAYNSSILLFFVGLSLAFGYLASPTFGKALLRSVFHITMLSAVFCVTEFVLKNLAGVDINASLPRPAVQEFNALALSEFFRSRGFAEESGHFALFLEVLTPVCLYYLFFSGYCSLHRYLKFGCVLLLFFSWMSTVSSASFIIVPLSYLAALVIFYHRIANKGRLFRLIVVSVLTLAGLLFIISLFFPVMDIFYLSIVEKLDSTSIDDRKARIDFFYQYFPKGSIFNWLMGYGPAAFAVLGFDDRKSILSLYHSVTFEAGLLGLLLILAVFAGIFLKILRFDAAKGFFFMSAFVATAVHYYFVSNYWFPWMWFLFALVVYFSTEKDGSGKVKTLSGI